MLETLTALFLPWSELYANSAWIPTAITAVHVLALFAGGGIAIAADRRVLAASPDTHDAYRAAADELRTTHVIVIGSLVLMVLSGFAMATSDVGTFAVSKVFWTKMATFGILLANGLFMRRTEARVLDATAPVVDAITQRIGPDRPWAVLKRTAAISLTAWFAIVLLGVVLSNV